MYSLPLTLTFCLSVCLLLAEFSASGDVFQNKIEKHAARCQADRLEPWSYRGDNGPNRWGELFPECHGLRQSPIFIDSRRVVPHRSLGRMGFRYATPVGYPFLTNDGHTIRVTPSDNKSWGTVVANNKPYHLRDIHFHWGSNKDVGSEHVVDGVQYPLEMHLVHESDRNDTAVVAVFFEEVDEINAELQHIVNAFPKVMYKDNQARLPYRLDLLNLLPENPASYYRYEGSLTTPNCTEGVIWSVLKVPNHVGQSQMREFRKLFSSPQNMSHKGCRISNNFRPLQHLHRRTVFTSL